jgi:RND family efflux transporter MFP subunit
MTERHEQNAAAETAALDRRRRRAVWLIGLGTLVSLVLLIGFGTWQHAARSDTAASTLERERNRVPLVRTQEVKVLEEPRQLDLPGTMQAFDSATVFARATGYIASRVVDIGSKVHAGDLLATIAAPELDQQLEQARAQISQLEAALEQARSNAELARVTNERTSRLVGQGWSTKQQGDNDRTNFEAQTAAVRVAEANLQAQRAQVSRLEELTGFERVVAPFDGTITERQVDVGNLVTADTASGTPMFSIARTNVLRVQVYVPQNAVFGVSDGAQAQVSVPEMPGRTFHGTIARNANALQSSTRTRLTEVDVDNADGTLFAGLYCIVRFAVPRTSGAIVIPSEAIVFDRNGISAAVFDNGVARLRHLDIAVDEGAQVEVRAGLNAGDRVILNPPVNLADGMRVQSADAEQPKDAPPNK